MSPGKEQGPGREEASDLASKCLPCREGCPFCRDDTPCTVQEDGALRLAVASFQGLCMVLDLASMVAVYHFRRNKVRGEGGLEPIHLRLEPTGILRNFPVYGSSLWEPEQLFASVSVDHRK